MFFDGRINKKLLLIKLSFFLYDFGVAPMNPFLPTIARQRGIPVLVIGLMFSSLPILNIIARPITGLITDRWQCRKRVFHCASVANAAVTLFIHFTPSFHGPHEYDMETDIIWHWKFMTFFCTIMVRNILWMVGDVLQDTICLEMLGDDKISYGKQRVWGAVGWGLSTLLVGVSVDWYSRDSDEKNYLPAHVIATTFLLLHFVVASKLECNQAAASKSITKDVIKITSDIRVSTYLVWATFGGIFTTYVWFYLFIYIEDLADIYHRERLPYIDTIQGFSITVQCCISEIPIYIMSDLILKRIGHMVAFSVSFMMFTIRFFLYSIITDPLWVLPVELLNGVTFTLAFVAGISYAAEVSPIGSEGTLQGLFGMAFHGLVTKRIKTTADHEVTDTKNDKCTIATTSATDTFVEKSVNNNSEIKNTEKEVTNNTDVNATSSANIINTTMWPADWTFEQWQSKKNKYVWMNCQNGFSIGSVMAGYTFNKLGSSISFRILSYVALFAFFLQVTVNKLVQIKRPKDIKPKEPAVVDSNISDPVAEEQNI